MNIPIYHVDTFTDKVFGGNPAAVCVLSKWLDEETLCSIAKENNLPATAFVVREGDVFNIRWITPKYELDLCGHGSLAAGFIIFNYLEPNWQTADLRSKLELLQVMRKDDLIILNFPAKNIEVFSSSLLVEGLGLTPKEMYQHKNDRCIAVLSSEDEVRELKPNADILKNMLHRGITVTAPGNKVDFVSRTFYPKINAEDPVTGASHCLLVPYWSNRLNKQDLYGLQLSERGGELFCRYDKDRVLLSGKAVLYMRGKIEITSNY